MLNRFACGCNATAFAFDASPFDIQLVARVPRQGSLGRQVLQRLQRLSLISETTSIGPLPIPRHEL
jgi:hypothetical protein